MLLFELIGGMAAFCTTIAFIPQVVKIWRTKHTKDISLGMYIIFTFGVLCWLIYGIYLVSIPMILANSVTIVLACTILIFKIKYK